MLVLSRKLSQQVLIGPDISITIVRIEGSHVRVGIKAPPGVSILREELVGRPGNSQSPSASHSNRRPVLAT
jgi:carbon storage regulator